MIGGTDILIPATGDAAALDVCTRILRHFWPRARFEDAVTGDKYEEYGEIPLGCVRELFVYRDAQAESDWDADESSTPENSMVYLILSSDFITVVLDDPDAAEMRSIVASLRISLHSAIQRTYAAAA